MYSEKGQQLFGSGLNLFLNVLAYFFFNIPFGLEHRYILWGHHFGTGIPVRISALQAMLSSTGFFFPQDAHRLPCHLWPEVIGSACIWTVGPCVALPDRSLFTYQS